MLTNAIPGAEPARELCPPRDGKIFMSKELGQQYLETVARYQGYAIVIKSNKGPGGQSRYFYCTRGHQNLQRASLKAKKQPLPLIALIDKDSKKTRKSSTAKSGCDFGVSLNHWKKQGHWKVRVQNAHHNHQPFKRESDLPRLRRFKEHEQGFIRTC